MKKFYTFLAAILLTTSTFAQAPEKMSYQAVVRDSGDALVTNQAVGMRISILQTTATGTAVYVETQTPTTNINGLVSLEIGAGTPVTGTFAAIDWATGPYFIKTETDPTGSTTYTITGTSQLMSVPYALYAENSGSSIPGPQGPAGVDGQGGVTTAGTNVTITGTGTVGDPYVVNATGGGSPTYTIGLWPELGGYVFWVSNDGKHGLVAETQDQGVTVWYEAQNLISNPSNHSVNGQKFRDWRMPTKFEFHEMYLQQGAIGGFATNTYWSSSEFYYDQAWVQDFYDGSQYAYDKNVYNFGIFNVRSVRAF